MEVKCIKLHSFDLNISSSLLSQSNYHEYPLVSAFVTLINLSNYFIVQQIAFIVFSFCFKINKSDMQ